VVVVCLGLAPFLSGLLFSLDETQIWLGDLRVVVVVGPVCLLVCFDLPAFMDQLCPCTNVFLTAYAHVRTEPQSDIGQTRGKKRKLIDTLPQHCDKTGLDLQQVDLTLMLLRSLP